MFPKANCYLEAARPGKHEWWRYLLALFVILMFWILLGSLPTIFLVGWAFIQKSSQGITSIQLSLTDLPMLPMFLATMFSFVFLLIGLCLAVVLIHRRKFISLITPSNTVNWRRLSQGFGVWFMIIALISAIEAVMFPGRYVLDFQPGNFVLFLILGIVFIPIQTSAEELLFRGYLIQALGKKLSNPWAISLISGLLFGVLHLGNPEVSANFWLLAVYYVVFGISLALITLWDGTLELVLGLHAANNLFSAIFATYPNGALQTPALFRLNVLDPVYNLVALGIALMVFGVLLLSHQNHRQPIG